MTTILSYYSPKRQISSRVVLIIFMDVKKAFDIIPRRIIGGIVIKAHKKSWGDIWVWLKFLPICVIRLVNLPPLYGENGLLQLCLTVGIFLPLQE